MQDKNTIPYGYCHCGCGQKTKLAPKTMTKRGWVKGQPMRYLHNHHSKNLRQPNRYTITDAGYTTPCWLWDMHLNEKGYGKIRSGGEHTGAHRYHYEMAKGPIPEGMVLDHLCRNRSCVNPDHLEPVTFTENIRRGAATTLTPEQVLEIRAMQGAVGAPTLSKQYGVSLTTIYAIWKRKTWKDLGNVA